MAQHTPGPWYTNPKPEAAQGLIYSETTGENIAVACDPKNAHLIAAAPDLLTALKDAILWVNSDDQDAPEMIAKWRAAIAAAQGEG